MRLVVYRTTQIMTARKSPRLRCSTLSNGASCPDRQTTGETNPYARLNLKVPSNIEKVKPLAEAWWRGWDRADAMLRNRTE